MGNKTRYLIFSKFFTYKFFPKLSRKYSKKVLIADHKNGFRKLKLFNILSTYYLLIFNSLEFVSR
ncbi:MAG: hypothetical protein A2066_02305 [Bacteroidetes bacterium GWB2_41_8]|nr:MAG: hypothetical protein A2066_02305 [Bacteroidetes bacterium GWB2_41_8]